MTNERSLINSNSDDVENEIRQLEEEIKSIKAARQAIKENRELQMPIIDQSNYEIIPPTSKKLQETVLWWF